MAVRRVQSEPRFVRPRETWDGGTVLDVCSTRGDIDEESRQREQEATTRTTVGVSQVDVEGLPEVLDDRVAIDADTRAEDTGEHTDTRSDTASMERKRYRRMIKVVDDILLQRAQVLQQLDSLRIARSSLESALDQLHDVLERSESMAPESAMASRHGDTGTRVSPDEPRKDVAATLADESLFETPSVIAQVIQPVRTIAAQIRLDLANVRQQEETFSSGLDSLSNEEYRLNKMQKAFANDLKTNPTRSMQLLEQLVVQDDVPTPTLESPEPVSDVPTLVQRYFEKRQDVALWLGWREELLDTWEEGKEEREFIADRGDPLEVSDEVFNAEYEERLAYIDRELETAEDDSDRILSLCSAENLDVERYKTRRTSISPRSSSEGLLSHQLEPIALGDTGVDQQGNAAASAGMTLAGTTLATEGITPAGPYTDPVAAGMPSATRQPSRKIQSWLQTVDQIDASPTEASLQLLEGAEPDLTSYMEEPPGTGILSASSDLAREETTNHNDMLFQDTCPVGTTPDLSRAQSPRTPSATVEHRLERASSASAKDMTRPHPSDLVPVVDVSPAEPGDSGRH